MRSKLFTLVLIMSLPLLTNAQKVTNPNTRLIGACYRTYSGTALYISDSDVYKYSGYNGGAPKNNGTVIANAWAFSGKYDTLIRRYFDSSTVPVVHNYYYYRDKTTDHYSGTNNSLDTSALQTYDTTAKVWNNKTRVVSTYDGSNNLKTALTQYWIASAWHDSTEHWYSYDGSNNLVADTSKNLGNAAQNRLTLYYYASSVLDSTVTMNWNTGMSMYVNNTKAAYFLNAGHKPDSTINYNSFTAGVWGFTGFGGGKDHYIYDGSYNLMTDSQFYYNAGTWNFFILNKYTYSGTDMVSDTLSEAFGGPFRYYNYWVNSYDGNHNELTSEKYTWLTSSSTWRDSALVHFLH